MAKEPLLDLTTFFDREHVLIDSKRYEYRNKDELSILDFEALSNHGKRISELAKKEAELTDQDVEELERLSASALHRILIGLTEEVISRLSLQQRTSIITVFTNLLTGLIPSGEARVETSSPPIGGLS
jgi:hypothetical protein